MDFLISYVSFLATSLPAQCCLWTVYLLSVGKFRSFIIDGCLLELCALCFLFRTNAVLVCQQQHSTSVSLFCCRFLLTTDPCQCQSPLANLVQFIQLLFMTSRRMMDFLYQVSVGEANRTLSLLLTQAEA